MTSTRVVLVLLFLPFAWYIYREAVRDVLVIDSVSVPKRYEELGFTSSVMALRVAEKLQQIEQQVQTTSAKDRLQQSNESSIPDIEVPATKLSLKTAVQLVQQALHSKPKHVRGEITFPWPSESNTTVKADQSVIVWYHIYSGSELRWAEKEEIRTTDPDTVVQHYAEGLLKRVNPYVWAVYVDDIKHDHPATLGVAQVMANSPDHQISAKGSFLIGYVLERQGKWEEAKEEYRKAAQLDPQLRYAYMGWGIVLDELAQG